MEKDRRYLLIKIKRETAERLLREGRYGETWDEVIERLIKLTKIPDEKDLREEKGELWEDLKHAIVPVLKKWGVPGSDAGRWDLYEALGKEVAKIDLESFRLRNEK